MRHLQLLASKAAAIGLTGIAALLIYVTAVSPVMHQFSYVGERMDEQRRLLGRFTELLNTPSSNPPSEISALKSFNFVILPGQTEQIKAAALQARVTKAADNVGIRLASLAVMPAQSRDGVKLVGIELQFQTGLQRAQAFLLALETQHPTVLVDSLQLSQAPDAAVRPGRELDARLVALGIVGKAEDAP
jgi:hypothetical protein